MGHLTPTKEPGADGTCRRDRAGRNGTPAETRPDRRVTSARLSYGSVDRQVRPPVRVLIVDDHDFFRTGLRSLLGAHPEIQVAGEASDGAAAVGLYARRRPDVVLMDLDMPGLSGVEATRRLLASWPDARVLMLTVSADDQAVLDALHAGASGYLLKEALTDEIVRGIHAVAMGQFIASPRIARSLAAAAEDTTVRAERVKRATSELTERELGILRLIAEGKGNGDIGRELHISPSTVKHHVGDILAKLRVGNRVEAAVYAVRSGIA